jgi:HEAT repeat protein
VPFVKKSLGESHASPGADADDRQHGAAAGLRSGSAQTRWQAARALAQFAGAVPALARQLVEEPDARVREAILTSLAQINNGESFDAIIGYLRVDDAALRTAALDALKLMPDVAGLRLDALLADPDADVRVLACDLARVAPPDLAQKSLAKVLAAEPEINVCAAAVELLAEIGTAAILPELERCAERFTAPFLSFSIRMAKDQIIARSAQPQA